MDHRRSGARKGSRKWLQQDTSCGQWTRLLVSHGRVTSGAFCMSSESPDRVPMAVCGLCPGFLVSAHRYMAGLRPPCC